jgi:uncharacterized protein YprB with RNaseH-like and TPR domain
VANPKWSDDDKKVLTRLYQAKVPRRDMVLALGRSYKAIDSMIFRGQEEGWLKGVPREHWWKQEGLTIGFLDIETTNLKANAGPMLSWALKVRGEKEVRYDVITRTELLDKTYDKRIVQSCIDNIREMDAVCTYFGSRFDIPFLRTRAIGMELDFPKYGEIFHWDLFYQARSKLLTHRKSLDVITTFMGIKGKTNLDIGVWFDARFGDQAALDYVLEHNRQDTIILEKAFDKLEPYAKWSRTSI